MNECLANQEASKFDGVYWQFCAAKAPDPAIDFDGHRCTHGITIIAGCRCGHEPAALFITIPRSPANDASLQTRCGNSKRQTICKRLQECLKMGDTWVHLRLCLMCGHGAVAHSSKISTPPSIIMPRTIRSCSRLNRARTGNGVTLTTSTPYNSPSPVAERKILQLHETEAPAMTSARVTPLSRDEAWPSLPFLEWKDTCETLHMWMQAGGKVRLALSPHLNHCGKCRYMLGCAGSTMLPIPYRLGIFEIEFDFQEHALRIVTSRGQAKIIPLS